jgi:hypothetical protein
MAFNWPNGVRSAIEIARQNGECDLSGLGLTEVPNEVTRITGLRTLSLRDNQLTEIPGGLEGISGLRVLALDNNRLTEIPAHIGNLNHLERLTLSNNKLTNLPPEIGLLASLNTLAVSRNMLTGIPEEIKLLRGLELLTASENQITELPPEIGELSNLQFLSLVDNRITMLPASLGNLLRAGLVLQLDGNPLDAPVHELYDQDPGLLAAYLDSLTDTIPHYEAKMLVVGEGNTGKTSLLAALRREPFRVGRATTHGIELRTLAVSYDVGGDLTMHAWDFGGQEVYRVTHQLFFSENALYLVVWKPREGQEQNEVEGWLRRIRLRVATAGRAFVIATHSPGKRNPELDYPSLKREFGILLGESFEVDNETGYGVADLSAAIAAEVKRFPQLRQAMSPHWVAARDEVLELSGSEPWVSLERFASICASHNIPADQSASLANLLHLTGQVIYYSDDYPLRDFIVLNPEWLAKAIGLILEDVRTRESGGILSHSRLPEILRPLDACGTQKRLLGAAYPPSCYPYLLRMMEKFDISYRMGDDGSRSLVAQMVPFGRPMVPWDSSSPIRQGFRRLAMVCRLSEQVPGLIAWLTVRHHDAATGLHWRNGVFLKHPITAYASEALVELSKPNQLLIDVRAPAPDYFFSVLRYSVEDLITRRWPGLGYELLVPCPTIDRDGVPCGAMAPLRDLMVYREEGESRFLCTECRKRHDISELITGFAQATASVQNRIDQLQGQIHADLKDIHSDIHDLQKIAADTAHVIQMILAAVRTEIADCPRLFTLSRDNDLEGLRKLRADQDHYRLILWCEEPSHWHPWSPASYSIDQPKKWIAKVAPYALLIFHALRLVAPTATTAFEAALSQKELSSVQAELDLMGTVIDTLPGGSPNSGNLERSHLTSSSPMTPAEGAAARTARSLIFSCDPRRSFGGLRRIQAPSGELLWVCPEHYFFHAPGLPAVPS